MASPGARCTGSSERHSCYDLGVALTVFVACAPGLEPWLAAELRGLGLAKARVDAGGVTFEGDAHDAVAATVRCGLASKVLVRLDRFAARHFSQLERGVRRVRWTEVIRAGAPWRVDVVSRRSRLYHTGAVVERVERWIGEAIGVPPSASVDEGQEASPGALIVRARILRDRCTLSLDLAGHPLHRRGWRQQTAKAPLREDLARGLLTVSGWSPGQTLLDPMMGSGTLLIEAATIQRGWAPGRSRDFAGRGWTGWNEDTEREARSAGVAFDGASVQGATPGRLVGLDRERGALEATRGNAERAGVLEDLELARCDVREDQAWPGELGELGTVVCNPPYGRRIGEHPKKLAPLFEALGRRIDGVGPGWNVAVLVPDRRLLAATGLSFEPRFMTSHGGLKVEAMVRPGLR